MSAIWDFANPQLRDLAAYQPGKPIEETARELGLPKGDIIKLASNENPFGPSRSAIEAMRRAATESNFYPDGSGYTVIHALAQRLALTPENFVLGNGSNEIIEFVAHAFLRPGVEAIISEHAFIAYRLLAALFGATVVATPEREYRCDLEAILAAITSRTRVIFIANPNNPTGTLLAQEAIDDFMQRVPEEIVVVFDEAYYEYLEQPPEMLQFVRGERNIVLLRTFSKIHGLAGARLGYGMAPPELIRILQKTREPFNINSLVQAGAVAALADSAHQIRTRRLTIKGRNYFQGEFARLHHRFIASSGNFVLVNVGDGQKVFRAMLERSVIIRALTGYNLPEWVRISVGTMEQNRKCMAALREVLGD